MEKECKHDWHNNYDCFEDDCIRDNDLLGIPVKCYLCNKEGIEWFTCGEVEIK